MSEHILYNFASKGRPKQFYDTINNIRALSANKNYTVLAKFDRSDTAYYDPQKLALYYPEVIEVRKDHHSKIEAINSSLEPSDDDIIVNISDDIVFTENRFDNIIRSMCGPDDFVLFPEPYAESQNRKGLNERISVVNITGGSYFKRFGYIYHPEYKSFFCDNEATSVARILGRYVEAKQSIYYHRHPTAGLSENDSTYLSNRKWWNHDKEVYFKRKKINFGLS